MNIKDLDGSISLRNQRQSEAAKAWMDSSRKSLLNAAPRFGKIKASIEILKELNPERILICAPRTDIFEGWKNDFKKFDYSNKNVEFVTSKSLKHKIKEKWDFFIIDEIQEFSNKQLAIADNIISTCDSLALSGTITAKTEREILQYTGMSICYKYSIEEAVNEGILCDYNIYVHTVDLDNKIKTYSGKSKTEKRYFDAISFVKDNKESYKEKWFLELKQIKVLQNSLAKINKTKELINKYEDQRLLIFTGLTDVANQLDVAVYHSKSKDRQVFLDFCKGENYKHLATVNMLQAGITILPIDKGIINYISGAPEQSTQKICRFLGQELNNPGKKAEIHIVTSREKFELNRLSTALSFF